MKDELNEILCRTECIQKEMKNFIDAITKTPRGKKLSYDSLKDVFFFMKLAELQEEIETLKERAIRTPMTRPNPRRISPYDLSRS